MLKSFEYGLNSGVSELPDEVLGLFKSLVENPDKKISYASEIIDAGLNGRIDFNREFNIDAYEAKIRKNEKLLINSKAKKESFIDFSGADDFDEVRSKGGIKVDLLDISTVEEVKDAFEEVLLSEELKYSVEAIKSLNEEFIVDYGTDLVFCLKRAVQGIPHAVRELKEICDNFPVVSDMIKTILSSKVEVKTLF